MSQVVLVGAGKIGQTICDFLIESGSFEVTLVDNDPQRLDHLPDRSGLCKRRLDVTHPDVLARTLVDHYAVVSAGTFSRARNGNGPEDAMGTLTTRMS